MKYNFDYIENRKNSNCLKYDGIKNYFGREDLIPLWVADMDFKICPEIQKKLFELINHGIFGYPLISDKYLEVISNWQLKNYNFKVENHEIILTTGVVSSIKHLINIFTIPGDNILIQSPVYYPFFNIIKQTKRNLLINKLIEKNNKYFIDFDDFKEKAKFSKLFILCNPHNPVGRVWNKQELIKIAEICLENNIIIISDEIHSDFTFENNIHIPIATLNKDLKKITITCNSPSKSFNLASLKISYIIVQDKNLMEKINKYSQYHSIDSPTILSLEALNTAYESCSEWLIEVKNYIFENFRFLDNYLKNHIPNLITSNLEGTYLAWIDFRKLNLEDETINNILINKANIALNPGKLYGPGGEGFYRINLATSRKILFLALTQLKEALNNYI